MEGGIKMQHIESKEIVAGKVTGEIIASNMPLSFWGGVDVITGNIIDVHHDLNGQNIKGKVLCIPFDRGSCSGSGIMLEMIRRQVAPKAIICIAAEPVLTLGSVMGYKIYNRGVVVHTVSEEEFKKLNTGNEVTIDEKGLHM